MSRLCLLSFQLTFGLTHASINVPQDLHIERGLETVTGKRERMHALEGMQRRDNAVRIEGVRSIKYDLRVKEGKSKRMLSKRQRERKPINQCKSPRIMH